MFNPSPPEVTLEASRSVATSKRNNNNFIFAFRFVNVHTPKDEVLIQTDKGKYKAGSNVTFRYT